MFVRPEQIAEIGKHPRPRALRLVVTRAGESDLMTLMAEAAAVKEALREEIAATPRAATRLDGQIVNSGALPSETAR